MSTISRDLERNFAFNLLPSTIHYDSIRSLFKNRYLGAGKSNN